MSRYFFWALPLLLITEGHMSGSVSYLTFEQIIRLSDAIVLARNIEPHVISQDVPVGEKPGNTFTFTLHRFAVKSVIHSRLDSGILLETLEVQSASDEDNYRQTQRYAEGGPHKILIYKYYKAQTGNVDSLPERVLFLRYNPTRKRFTFAANGAMEGPELVPQIRQILSLSP